MSTRAERAQAWLDKREATTDAIQAGIAQAKRNGLTKPYDVAVSVMVALDNSELTIIRKARRGRGYNQ